MPLPTLLLVLILSALLAAGLTAAPAAAPATAPAAPSVQLRGLLDNCRLRFERERQGHVAFMGGSITEMDGYRPLVCALLKQGFPNTQFTFTSAGISSTCSTTGAFRLPSDVLSKGPVDLFFVEFAVNDDQDAHHARRECIRGMEGIIRQFRRTSPQTDIVMLHFVNPDLLSALRAGQTPLTIAAHEAVAQRYGVPTVSVAGELARRVSAGTFTWEKFGGVHPGPAGNALAADLVGALLDRAWAKPLAADARKADHALPDPLDALCYERGRFVDPKEAKLISGWQLHVPDWAALKGGKRDRFTKTPLLEAVAPGAELTLDFEGTAIGAYVVAGPDAGVLEAKVDDGPAQTVDLYHHFSSGLHYPRTVMLGTDLKPGRHTLRLRVSDSTHSAGHAARILQFGVN